MNEAPYTVLALVCDESIGAYRDECFRCSTLEEAIAVSKDFSEWEIWRGEGDDPLADLVDTSTGAMARYYGEE